MLERANSIPRTWVWVIAELIRLAYWDSTPMVRGRASSPRSLPLRLALPYPWWGVESSLWSAEGQLSLGVSSKAQGQLPHSKWGTRPAQHDPIEFQHKLFLWPAGVAWVMNIKLDLDCCLVTNTGMVLASAWVWWSHGPTWQQVHMALVSGMHSDTNMAKIKDQSPCIHVAFGGTLGHIHQHRP